MGVLQGSVLRWRAGRGCAVRGAVTETDRPIHLSEVAGDLRSAGSSVSCRLVAIITCQPNSANIRAVKVMQCWNDKDVDGRIQPSSTKTQCLQGYLSVHTCCMYTDAACPHMLQGPKRCCMSTGVRWRTLTFTVTSKPSIWLSSSSRIRCTWISTLCAQRKSDPRDRKRLPTGLGDRAAGSRQ